MKPYYEKEKKRYRFGIGIVSIVMICVFVISYLYWKENSTVDSMAAKDQVFMGKV